MSLIEDLTAADDAQPVLVFAARIGADLLGPPFRIGRLAVVRVLAPTDQVVIGTIYLLVDCEAGEDVAPEVSGSIARLLGESPDVWLVDEFVPNAPCRRRSLSRPQWQARASINIADSPGRAGTPDPALGP
jgi:hypothetical protein